MKAIVIKKNEVTPKFIITEYPKPEPIEGYVLIKNKAFGVNRAEVYMRKGEWGETHDVIGIELVGVVENDPSGTLKDGQKVVSFVGGLAREFSGSYAEYVNVPLKNCIPIETSLPWNELAAIPETFATAWAILFKSLEAKPKQTLLVRGGTSTIGLASIILAKQLGLNVLATTRSEEKFKILKDYGADYIILENGKINEQLREVFPKGVENVIELIGNSTLEDSLSCVKMNGTVCIAGFLGGLHPVENFMPLMQIPSSVKLTSFGSAFVFGSADFPYSEIPIQRIISGIEHGEISNILSKTFKFDQIYEAHQLMESNTVNGKIVITV